MTTRRRTIPRSALRASPLSATPPTSGAGLSQQHPATSAPRFSSFSPVPKFSPEAPAAHFGANLSTALPASSLRAPCTVFEEAPLSCVRWLGGGGGDALAAVGGASGDGDSVSLYSVGMGGGEDTVSARLEISMPCAGKIMGMAGGVGGGAVGGLGVACGDGGVMVLGGSVEDGLHEICAMPKADDGSREPAADICVVSDDRLCVVGGNGSLLVADASGAGVVDVIPRADGIGFRAVAAADPEGGDVVVAAGASGVCGIWDWRVGRRDKRAAGELRHPERGVSTTSICIDSAQPQYVLGGQSNGEVVVWDRRYAGDAAVGGEKAAILPLTRLALHTGCVWGLGVVRNARPGLLLSCGEDGLVWLMDFGAAAARSAAVAWSEGGDFWRAQVARGDLRNVAAGVGTMLGINSIDAHSQADLFAYTSDSASVTFGSLYSRGAPARQ